MSKVELELKTDADVRQLVAAFEGCTLDISHWTHRAHLAVGACYARSLPPGEALDTMRTSIQRFNAVNNNPTGYNETITRLFLAKMAFDNYTGSACRSLAEEVQRLTQVCTMNWLYRYYSKSLIHSSAAKSQWVAPDLSPLDI